jgi:hypothetical protein
MPFDTPQSLCIHPSSTCEKSDHLLFPTRHRGGIRNGELIWKRLSYRRVLYWPAQARIPQPVVGGAV